jgi:uncharacterized protein
VSANNLTPSGWYTDPIDKSLYRYWDGSNWTYHTSPRLLATPHPETVRTNKKSYTVEQRWGLGEVGLGLLTFFFISVVLVIMAAAFFQINGEQELTSPVATAVFIVAGAFGSLVAFAGAPLFASYVRGVKNLTKDFGLKFTWLDLPIGLGLAFGGLLVGGSISLLGQNIFGEEVTNTGGLPTATDGFNIFVFLVTFVSVALVIPVVEELFFRGLTLRALDKRFSTTTAVVGSSAFFGLMHFAGATNIGGLIIIPLVTGLYGLIFALITIKTKRLGASIVGHIIINGLAVTFAFIS